MKIKVTEKQIKNSYNNIISVGYCDLNYDKKKAKINKLLQKFVNECLTLES